MANEYERLTKQLKRSPTKGLTLADAAAKTGLPLNTVKELLPQAADEFSGRLEVTESGEILYSFPKGFVSRYHGFKPGLRRVLRTVFKALRIGGTAVFKVWIMVMLIGYFLVFMLLALASLILPMLSRDSNGRSGGSGASLALFNMIMRIWFYSEIFRPRYDVQYAPAPKKKGRPLHKAIFAFVFGDGDANSSPEAAWKDRENKVLVAYIQNNKGIISLPELMSLTGLQTDDAERRMSELCSAFGGSPEATEDGVIIYRFEELLRRADTTNRSFAVFSAPIKALQKFSLNKKGMNAAFAMINGVNFLFGGYYLTSAISIGVVNFTEHLVRRGGEIHQVLSMSAANGSPVSWLYGMSYHLFHNMMGVDNPLPIFVIGLGLVPISFSLLFWGIPALRALYLKKQNRQIKMENFRKIGFRKILDNPLAVRPAEINSQIAECSPANQKAAALQVMKDMGNYASPEITLDENRNEIYSFSDLEREKEALERERGKVQLANYDIGERIFDTAN
ncbi:MAG: hypothetical protein LBM77_04475 [Spirochaetaceae bacterium]|jgi:hypothetical protein|nr:hypothetical protein [Spirochaetaceae bacterium]